MARIAGVDLPNNKRGEIGLTYIFGIGRSSARKILEECGIDFDTHGLLRPEVLDRIAGCDVIIHGGDINKPEIIARLKEIAPVYVVRGNNDKEWAENIPESLTFQIEQCRFFVVHNRKSVPKDLHDTDVVIYGHSHKYAEQMVDGVLWLNPGSCGKRRFDQEITFAIMTVDGSERAIEKITIPNT